MTIDDINITAEKNNAKQHAKLYYAMHMEPGVVKYENEMLYVPTDAIKRMMPSFSGKPVYVRHQQIPIEEIQNRADGYVSETFYNDLDGAVWSKVLITSDAGDEAVQKGWGVSNAYLPKKWKGPGSYHNIDFHREIEDAEFTHLAIEPNPRYENAMILTPGQFKQYQDEKRAHLNELHNSKGVKPMFKIFRKADQEITNSSDIQENDIVKLEGGKEVTIKEMLNAVTEADRKKAEEDKAAEVAKKLEDEKKNSLEDKEFEVNGKKVTFKQLQDSYLAIEKQNSANADKKAEEEEKLAEEEKRNSKSFSELQNAGKATVITVGIETSQEKIARGKLLY